MKYHNHIQDMGQGRSFTIIVDDQTMTWTTEPPGNNIAKPLTLYFSLKGGGPIGSGRNFTVLPGGRAQ